MAKAEGLQELKQVTIHFSCDIESRDLVDDVEDLATSGSQIIGSLDIIQSGK